jgi:hypothetical protein
VVIAKREMNILITVLVLGVVALLYTYGIDPYLKTGEDIVTGKAKLDTDLKEDLQKFKEYRAMLPEWEIMKKNGLQEDSELVQSQTMRAIQAWSEWASVNVKGYRTDKPAKEGDFIVRDYDFNLEGTMNSVSRLIWALENSPVPLRISDLNIAAAHEGVDDLMVRMKVSALSVAPPEKPAAPTRTVSSAAGVDLHQGAGL